MTIDIILSIVYTQLVLIPILGALFLATRNERRRISKLGEIKERPVERQVNAILSGISERLKTTECHIKKYRPLTPTRLSTDGDYGRKVLERLLKKKEGK